MIDVPFFSFDAIIASNGLWQAAAGGSIVILGLSVLSVVIAQIHKILNFFESRSGWLIDLFAPSIGQTDASKQETVVEKKDPIPFEVFPDTVLHHKDEILKKFVPLTKAFGEYFILQDLFRAFYENEIPHAHLTIKTFREAKILVTTDNEKFSWNLD